MTTRPEDHEHKTPIKRPTSADAASQTRQMGLKIGETIIGRETWPGGWRQDKLKLVWRGASVAVFENWHMIDRDYPIWRYEGEKSTWKLNWREWFLIKE